MSDSSDKCSKKKLWVFPFDKTPTLLGHSANTTTMRMDIPTFYCKKTRNKKAFKSNIRVVF
jgi:hypothetical protein